MTEINLFVKNYGNTPNPKLKACYIPEALITYRMNGGKIIDLLIYQERKQKREKRIEKKEELVKELRRV